GNAWAELSMKRLIRMAAEGGYAQLAWTTGEQQAERYDLSSKIDAINVGNRVRRTSEVQQYKVLQRGENDFTIIAEPAGTGTGLGFVSFERAQQRVDDLQAREEVPAGRSVELHMPDGGLIQIGVGLDGIIDNVTQNEMKPLEGKPLDEAIGKELADRILKIDRENLPTHLTGVDLKVGGEGMKSFYDKTLRNIVNKVVRKLDKGVKTGETKIDTELDLDPKRMPAVMQRADVHAIDITDQVRMSVLSGQALFSMKSSAFTKWFGDSKVVDENGEPLVVYHGTTADFAEFSPSKANTEADFGAGFYFTNSVDDLLENYAGLGPDLTQKIERKAERLAQEQDKEYDDPEIRAQAMRALMTNEGATMPVYLRMENPLVVGGSNETFLDFEQEYDEEADEYGEEGGTLVELILALRFEAEYAGANAEQAISGLLESGIDGGLRASEAIQILFGDEELGYAEGDEGQPISKEIIRDALRAAGFDGVIDNTVDEKFGSQRVGGMVGMDEDTVHYIAFEPEQIKSAIGNRGTYDSSANITFALKGDVKSLGEDAQFLKSFDEKTGGEKGGALETLREWRDRMRDGKAQRMEIKLIDEFAGILHMEEELGIKRGGYMSVRLAAGVDVIIRSALDNAVPTWHTDEDGGHSVKMDEGSKGLTEILSPLTSAELLHSFERYLVANRSRRLIKEGKEKLVSREEIAAVLKDVRKKGQYKLFVKVQKELDTYKSKILDFAQEAGLIDPVSRKLWEKHDHIPFYRVLAKHDKNGAFAKLGSVGKVIHYQRGSTAKLKPALENIFDNISMLIEASVKNRAMSDVINQFKDSGVVTKVPKMEISTALIPMDQIKAMLKDAGIDISAETEEFLTGIQRMMSLKHTQEGDNVVSMQVKGKKEFYYVHDEGVMGGMEAVGAKNFGWMMKILRAPKRLITLIITRFPGFVFANWFRDMLHSFVLIRYGQTVPVVDSIAGWAEAMYGSQTFKEMMAGGGMFDSGYINTSDPGQTVQAMKRGLMKAGRGNILDSPRKLAKLYLRFTNGAENAARIGIFKKALRKTGSRKQALYEARDIMDFSVRGSSPFLQFFIETVPFLGARIQGLARTGRGFAAESGTERMWVAGRGFMVVLATVALYLNNRDRDEYKALLDYDKHMYYHFFDVFEQGDHYRLPKPFEVGAMFSTVPEIGLEYMLSQESDKGKAVGEALWWVLMEQFNLRPTVQLVTPIYELAVNKNLFTGAPIENYWESQLDASRRYNDRTNKTLVWLAQNMPEDAPDFMRSPKQLEFLLKRYFATLADYSLGIADRMLFSEGAPTPRLDEQFPVTSRFRREPFPKFDKYQEAMYDVLDRAETIYQTIQDLKKDRTPDARAQARRIKETRRALLFARRKMTPTYKQIQLVNKKIVRIHANKNMTPDEKKERLDRLIDRKRNLAERIYKYRPRGEKNPYDDEGNKVERDNEVIWQWLNNKTKREQVDALIGANLPHAATLINDVTIGATKLKDSA
ncbi:hypothetical protein LCGC14_0373890, partial [marine sediment metagenome]